MFDVLIIEDDLLEQTRTKSLLKQIGYTSLAFVSTLADAYSHLITHTPLLIVADVFLEGETALELGEKANLSAIPTIFITACKDISVYNSIKEKTSIGYLTKPLDPITLLATINLVISKSTIAHQTTDFLFINQGRKLLKIAITDILWLEVEGNYTFIYTASFKYVLKKSISRLVEDLGSRFVRCHKKFAVNIDQIHYVKSDAVVINDQEIPISYTFKKNFKEELRVLRNSKYATITQEKEADVA